MVKTKSLFIFSVVYLLLGNLCAFATTYYVNKNATGTNDGTSLANAYTSIQAAFNRDLAPDDIVEVSAGTYYEAVVPGTDDTGTSGHPVILRAKAGDIVTLDGQGTRDWGITLNNVSYFTVDGFYIKNFRWIAVYLPGALYGRTIKNCKITVDPSQANGQSNHGICGSGSFTVFDNNTITQLQTSSGTQEADGIYFGEADSDASGYGDNIIVSNNTVIIRNTTTSGPHVDGMQLENIRNAQIYNNTIYIAYNADHRQGLFCEWYNISNPSNYGTCKIYNNLIYGYGSSYLMQIHPNDTAIIIAAKIYSNTVDSFATDDSLPFNYTGTNLEFKNNIIICRRTGSDPALAFSGTGTPSDKSTIDYNFYYVPNPHGDLFANATWYPTLAAWKAAGYDAHSHTKSTNVNVDPNLDAFYRPLSTSSPVAKVGKNLSTIFFTDRTNTPRQTSPDNTTALWDVGALKVRPTTPLGLKIINTP